MDGTYSTNKKNNKYLKEIWLENPEGLNVITHVIECIQCTVIFIPTNNIGGKLKI